jgi:hypothetical protein
VEWLIGIYLIIGFVKALNFATNPMVALRPQWAGSSSGLGSKLVAFCFAALLWPFIRSQKLRVQAAVEIERTPQADIAERQAIEAEKARQLEISNKKAWEFLGNMAVIVGVLVWLVIKWGTPDSKQAALTSGSQAAQDVAASSPRSNPTMTASRAPAINARGAVPPGGSAQAGYHPHTSSAASTARNDASGVVSEPPRFASFMETVRAGTTNDVAWMVKNGADVNMRVEGTTPLIEAVRASKYGAAKVLFLAGADPNRVDGGGMSAIDYAKQHPENGIAELLMGPGAVAIK